MNKRCSTCGAPLEEVTVTNVYLGKRKEQWCPKGANHTPIFILGDRVKAPQSDGTTKIGTISQMEPT